MKILIPVDGSDSAVHAVEHVIASRGWLKETPEVFLLNVQWKITAGNVKLFIDQDTVNDYYREQGLLALAAARQKLDAAGMAYTFHISIGTPAEAIVQYAAEQQVDQIALGARGENTLSTLLLGSVVNKVLHLAKLPVLVVR
ncbi:MAG: universal stress protein [Sideroxydans sp.]|nr:universal stress protein [Sideroxydans sp.]